jgi:hypothetical protein
MNDRPVLIKVDNRGLLTRHRRPAGSEPVATVRQREPEPQSVLAHVHMAPGATKGARTSRPPFTLHAPADGALVCSVQPAADTAYDVYGADGAALGRITRQGGRALPWPRRVRWTVQTSDGAGRLDGAVGTLKGWWLTVVLSPVLVPIWLVGNVYAFTNLLLGPKEFKREYISWSAKPSYTRWRGNAADGAIEYRGGHLYRIDQQRLDHRLALAQAVLHIWDESPADDAETDER